MRRRFGVGHRHHDRERRAVGRRREPLLAVDHVVVAVGDCGGGEQHRVRPGGLRFGHREAAADLAGHQRAQEPLTLLVGRVLVQDLDVARIGCLGAEHGHAQRAAPDSLGEQPVVDHRQPEPAELDRMVRCPQPHLLHLLLGSPHADLQHRRVTVQHLALEGDHFAVHELADHREHHRHLLRHVEIHGASSVRVNGTEAGGHRPGHLVTAVPGACAAPRWLLDCGRLTRPHGSRELCETPAVELGA